MGDVSPAGSAHGEMAETVRADEPGMTPASASRAQCPAGVRPGPVDAHAQACAVGHRLAQARHPVGGCLVVQYPRGGHARVVVARQVRRVPANARVAVERAVTRDAGRTPWMYPSFLMSMCSSSPGLWRAGLNMGGRLDAAETSFVRNRIPRANTFRLPCDAKINEDAGMVCRLLWRIPGVFIAAIMTCAPIWAQDSLNLRGSHLQRFSRRP